MILITTSRRPTQRMRTFCNDLQRALPNTVRVNRGKLSLEGVAEKALELEADRVILIERWRGGPGKIELYQLSLGGLERVPPIIYLAGIKTQEEFGRKQELREGLIVTIAKGSPVSVKRLAQALSDFLKIPLFETNSEELDFQASIHLSQLQKYEAKLSFTAPPAIREIGPSLTVRRSVWENLGRGA